MVGIVVTKPWRGAGVVYVRAGGANAGEATVTAEFLFLAVTVGSTLNAARPRGCDPYGADTGPEGSGR